MLQREVADRVLAAPGGGDYGPLAVMLGLFADRSRVLSLPPGAFRPAPAVHSAVVRLAFRPPPVPVDDVDAVNRVVRTAFQQRRKTLANALRPLAARRPAELADALARAGVDGSRRPETLTGVEFVRLTAALIPLSVL
jgi:16S rRNA (adenine1518-N6/adenine1519-N6)-dimethyltransferase